MGVVIGIDVGGSTTKIIGVENKSIQRLIRTEKHPTEENMIILHDWLFSGYDVTIRQGDRSGHLALRSFRQVYL